MKKWVEETEVQHKNEYTKFHDTNWTTGEARGRTREWLQMSFDMSGLGTPNGDRRIPPKFGKEMIWAIEHLKKYLGPENDDVTYKTKEESGCCKSEEDRGDWEFVDMWE